VFGPFWRLFKINFANNSDVPGLERSVISKAVLKLSNVSAEWDLEGMGGDSRDSGLGICEYRLDI